MGGAAGTLLIRLVRVSTWRWSVFSKHIYTNIKLLAISKLQSFVVLFVQALPRERHRQSHNQNHPHPATETNQSTPNAQHFFGVGLRCSYITFGVKRRSGLGVYSVCARKEWLFVVNVVLSFVFTLQSIYEYDATCIKAMYSYTK